MNTPGQHTLSDETVDRTQRPAPQARANITLPSIRKARLSNGLTIWLVEKHDLPVVAFNLIVHGGSDHDPVDAPGISSMTAELIDEGTQSRTALDIADEFDSIGATFNVRSTLDATFVSLGTLSKHLDNALAVYADIIADPMLPESEFDRLRSERLTGLLQQRDDPAKIASAAFSRTIYGTNHPYGNNPAGTERSIRALRREDLVDFADAYYRPGNSSLVVVGDVSFGTITTNLERILKNWKPGINKEIRIPSPQSIERRRIHLIGKPGAVQSEIRIGYPALARNTPEFFSVTVMNRILGGQFNSRLNLSLREKHGFSYGVRSTFSFAKQRGPFLASGAVATATTDKAVQEFLREIDLMNAEGATDEEVEFVKKGLMGNFALNFETPAQIAGALTNIVLYDLPENYLDTYIESIHSVSVDQVNRAANKYLDSSKMAVVIVGDLNEIRGAVETLQLGEIVECDIEGNVLKQ